MCFGIYFTNSTAFLRGSLKCDLPEYFFFLFLFRNQFNNVPELICCNYTMLSISGTGRFVESTVTEGKLFLMKWNQFKLLLTYSLHKCGRGGRGLDYKKRSKSHRLLWSLETPVTLRRILAGPSVMEMGVQAANYNVIIRCAATQAAGPKSESRTLMNPGKVNPFCFPSEWHSDRTITNPFSVWRSTSIHKYFRSQSFYAVRRLNWESSLGFVCNEHSGIWLFGPKYTHHY